MPIQRVRSLKTRLQYEQKLAKEKEAEQALKELRSKLGVKTYYSELFVAKLHKGEPCIQLRLTPEQLQTINQALS